MHCVVEACGKTAEIPIREGGKPVVCREHLLGAAGWVMELKTRVGTVGAAIFASLVTQQDALDAESAADLALDLAAQYLERLDARFS